MNLLAITLLFYFYLLPKREGFWKQLTAVGYTNGVLGLNGNDAFDFSSNTSNGRLRTVVNTGFARTGTKAATLDQSPYEEAI